MKKQFKRGQSILEYTLLLAAIIAVIIAVLMGTGGEKSGIKGKVEETYNKVGDALTSTTDELNIGIFKDATPTE